MLLRGSAAASPAYALSLYSAECGVAAWGSGGPARQKCVPRVTQLRGYSPLPGYKHTSQKVQTTVYAGCTPCLYCNLYRFYRACP